jgi:hypothetical protein
MPFQVGFTFCRLYQELLHYLSALPIAGFYQLLPVSFACFAERA